MAELSTRQESNLQPPYLTPMGCSCQLQEPSGELASYMKCLVNTAGSAVFSLVVRSKEFNWRNEGTKRADWWNDKN